jgi:hypothetical protein
MERKDGVANTATTAIFIPPANSKKYFKPASLHSGTLGILLLVTLALLGLVEYACRALDTVNSPPVSNIVSDVLTDIVIDSVTHDDSSYTTLDSVLRCASCTEILPTMNSSISRARHIVKTVVVTTYYDAASVKRVKARQTSAPPPNVFLNTVHTLESILVSTPNPIAYLNIDATSTADSATVPFSRLTADLDMTTISASLSQAPAPPNYLQTATPTLPSPGNPNPEYYLHKSGHISNGGVYFVGAYLPTVLAILFSLPWIIINHTARSIEPFWQLSRPKGVSAEHTLNTAFHAPLAPLQFLLRGQCTVVITTTLMGLGILITPLAPEAVAIHTDGQCDATTVGCTGRLRISIPVARTIQVILAGMALLTIVLTICLRKKRLPVLSDPRSIAGLSLLFLNPDVRQDFAQIQTLPTERELDIALRGNTYKIDTMTFQDGFTSTGLIKLSGINASPELLPSEKHDYSTLNWDRKLSPAHRVSVTCLFVFLLALEALILAYHYTSGDNGFEQFMDSQGFGVRFLFTLVGVVISLYWRSIFEGTYSISSFDHNITYCQTTDIALLAPYRALVLGAATAQSSILFTPPSHPLLAIYASLSANHYVLALTALAAVLSEILTITLSTIPFSSANLYTAYQASTWISAGIIIIMLGVLSRLFFYHEPKLPVKPQTVAARLVYLSDCALPVVFKDLGGLDTMRVEKRVKEWGYRYRLDMIQSHMGMSKLNVDFER